MKRNFLLHTENTTFCWNLRQYLYKNTGFGNYRGFNVYIDSQSQGCFIVGVNFAIWFQYVGYLSSPFRAFRISLTLSALLELVGEFRKKWKMKLKLWQWQNIFIPISWPSENQHRT